MNDLFDALNRRFPGEGIKKNSKDLEVLIYVLHEHEFLCRVRIPTCYRNLYEKKTIGKYFFVFIKNLNNSHN